MENGLRYSHAAGFFQRVGHEAVRFSVHLDGANSRSFQNKRGQFYRPEQTHEIQFRYWLRFKTLKLFFSGLHVIAPGKFKAAHQIVSFPYDFADGTNQLISHARATLFVQPVHVDALILNRGMDFSGNTDKTEGKNPGADRRTHVYRLASPYAAFL